MLLSGLSKGEGEAKWTMKEEIYVVAKPKESKEGARHLPAATQSHLAASSSLRRTLTEPWLVWKRELCLTFCKDKEGATAAEYGTVGT